MCYTDNQCDYAVFSGGVCYLGDFSNTESIVGTLGAEYVQYRSQDSELMNDVLTLYEDYSKFRSDLWPKFVYTYYSSGGNEKICAARCAIRETACHFYYHSGSYCYFGDFTKHTNPYYLGETAGPFKILKNGFGKCNILRY